jgi:hypothetical protein
MIKERKKQLFLIATLLITVLSLISFASPTTVRAEGGIAISGSFYRQHFQLTPGESISNPDINIVVFNNYDETIDIKLSTETPPGVTIDFAQDEFTIAPHSNITIITGVSVGTEVIPGDYKILVSASVVPNAGTGITIASAAELQADLTVFGEAGSLTITTQTPDGEPFAAELHLFRKDGEQLSPAGFSSSGTLETRLVPGNYMVQGFYENTEVATSEFSITADEHREIKLIAQTVFLYGFNVVPVYNEENGELSYANIIYTFTNIHIPLKDFQATLDITLKGHTLETDTVINIPTLDVGETSGTYKYIPSPGWQTGTYTFVMSVFSQGYLYGQSAEKTIENVITGSFNWTPVIIIAAIAAIGLVIFFYMRKRRGASGKKPAQKKPAAPPKEKAPPKQPQEKPAEKKEAKIPEYEAAHFSSIELEPTRELATGELTEVKVSYMISNPKAGLEDVRIELNVTQDNEPLENLQILRITVLNKGKGKASYVYIPQEGWQTGVEYSFSLSLYSGDELIATSPSEAING